MKNLKEAFDSLGIKFGPSQSAELKKTLIKYEMRDEHPLALNSANLGVNRIIFTTNDREALFDLFGLVEAEVSPVLALVPSLDKSRKVTSDTFNLLCAYTLYTCIKSRAPMDTMINALIYLHYRFFTSLLIKRFPLGANPDIMTAVIEDLSLKFDIKEQGTWKKVIRTKCEAILSQSGIHRKTLESFVTDEKVYYFLSDTQTRLRNQINLITTLYYKYKENNDMIASTSATMTVDGEKVLRESTGGFGNVSMHLYSKVLNKRSFIDEKYMQMILSHQKDITKSILQRSLIIMSDTAKEQDDRGQEDRIIHRRTGEVQIIGVKALISAIMSSVYKSAIADEKVNVNNKLAIFMMSRRLYTSSRTKNEMVLQSKSAIRDLIIRNKISKRETTISSLTVAIPTYLTLMSFDALNR